ncbi:MAG: 2Fe-2S iron-sulfur cluster-binding protein [Thermoleophilia bacterium]
MPDYAPVDLSLPDQVEFELNGVKVTAPAGTMLVDAAFAHGVEVPVFCYEPRLGPPLGACRMCLVEVEGMRGLQTACSTPVQPDMVVRTNSELAKDGQDGVLEFLLENHPLDCPVCDKGGECPLQDRTFRFGPGRTRFVEPKRHFPKPLQLSSLIALDRERCISCYRCVRFSQDVAEDGHLVMEQRGAAAEIATATGDQYSGRFTGNVIDICPVGALTSIPYRFRARPWDVQNAPSVCGHCPAGCNTELTSREGDVMRVNGRPEPNYAVEEGWICDKGRFAYPGNRAATRIATPSIHDAERVREATLDEAVDAAALVLRGAERVGVVVGPTATVEEGFLAQDLAAALPGALIQRLGIPGDALAPLRALPSAQLADLDRAGLVVIVGGDPPNQQAIVELRTRKARRLGATVLTVGPRPHELEPIAAAAVRSAPGRLAEAVAALEIPEGATDDAIVVWDEVDLAAEPAAAAAVAALVRRLDAAQLELGADVNGAGLRAIGLPADGVLEAAGRGEIDTLVTIHADPLAGAGAGDWGWALGRVRHHVAIAAYAVDAVEGATVTLPAATHYETEGVYVSMNGRAQRLRPGAVPPEGAAPGWELLIALLHRVGAPPAYRTPAKAFEAAAAANAALAGLTYDALGVLGRPVKAPPAPAPAAAAAAANGAGGGLALVTTRRIFGDAPAHRSDALAALVTGAELVLNPAEASRHGVGGAGARARLRSPHGEVELPVRLDEAHPEGAAFVTVGVPGAGVERLLPADRGQVRVEVTAA